MKDRASSADETAVIGDAVLNAGEPLRLWDGFVQPEWIDYNGHMTEFRYAQVFSETCEALLKLINMHAEYVSTGYSYYTAETYSRFHDEADVNDAIHTTTQIVFVDAKRLHVFYSLYASEGDRLLATMEVMYLHVGMQTGKVCAAGPDASKILLRIGAAQANLLKPEAVGRYVGQRNLSE